MGTEVGDMQDTKWNMGQSAETWQISHQKSWGSPPSTLNACVQFKFLQLALVLLHLEKPQVFLNNGYKDWRGDIFTFFLFGGNFRKRSTTQRCWKIKQNLINIWLPSRLSNKWLRRRGEVRLGALRPRPLGIPCKGERWMGPLQGDRLPENPWPLAQAAHAQIFTLK